MNKRHIKILTSDSGSGFPLAIAITLSLLLIFSCAMEFFRLNIIVMGVKEALQSAIITTVNDNYYNVYHGAREGYSGGYQPSGGTFAYAVDEGDVLALLDGTLGTRNEGGLHTKYVEGKEEYTLSNLLVRVAPASSATECFEADAQIHIKVPVRFAGKILPSLTLNLKVQAGYIEVF